MIRSLRFLSTCLAVAGLVMATAALADPQGKSKGKGGGNQQKQEHGKKQNHMSGKDLVGDKIKQNGTHKIHDHGKFSTFVNVSGVKIAGVNVKHSEKGDIKVTKYKTNRKMAQGPPSGGFSIVSAAYAQDEYLGTIYIGFAYIDDLGEEVIYWFPVDMILDGDTGAIDYRPAE